MTTEELTTEGRPPIREGRLRSGLRKTLEVVVLALMASLAIVVVVGVGFRKAGASLVWYDEVASILLAWLTYYGAALAALHRAHIGMPTVVDRMRGKLRTVTVLAGEACTLAFFAVLTWAGVRVLSVLGGTSLVSLPSVPMWVAQSVIPIGGALFILAEILSIPDALAPPVPDDDLGGFSMTTPAPAIEAEPLDAPPTPTDDGGSAGAPAAESGPPEEDAP